MRGAMSIFIIILIKVIENFGHSNLQMHALTWSRQNHKCLQLPVCT